MNLATFAKNFDFCVCWKKSKAMATRRPSKLSRNFQSHKFHKFSSSKSSPVSSLHERIKHFRSPRKLKKILFCFQEIKTTFGKTETIVKRRFVCWEAQGSFSAFADKILAREHWELTQFCQDDSQFTPCIWGREGKSWRNYSIQLCSSEFCLCRVWVCVSQI